MIVFGLLLPALARDEYDLERDDLEPKHRVDPRFPAGAQGPAQCIVRVWVDERGRAHDPEAQVCAEPFAAAAEYALDRWRFVYKVPVDEDVPQRVPVFIAVKFTRDAGAAMPEPPARCEWPVGLAPDGTFTLLQRPPPACALWLPQSIDPALVPAAPFQCRVVFRKRADQDKSACPEALHALADEVIEDSFFWKAGEHELILVPSP